MIRMSKTVDNFAEIYQILNAAGYNDDIMGDMGSIDAAHAALLGETTTIKDINQAILTYAIEHIPGYFNHTFPNCINLNIGPFGFSYMKDGIGFGVYIKMSKKSDMKYTLTFSFNKDNNYLKHSSVYNYALENDFEVKEIENKKKSKKN